MDPNRVLDVILTAFEFHFDNDNFITIIKKFRTSGIAPIIGTKFLIFSKNASKLTPIDEVKGIESQEDFTPYSLYQITAKLIKKGFFKIEDIF